MATGKRKNTRAMHRLRDAFFAEGKAQDANEATRPLSVCWLCGGRVDYVAKPGTTDDSHHLDHFHAVEDRPDLQEDPSGFRHAHRRCNLHRGRRTPHPGLGDPVPEWW